MDKAPLERLDSFPYRHRVAEVMGTPLSIAEPGMTLEAASRRMVEEKVSSLVTLDEAGRPTGIVTERDILRALAEHGADAAADRIEAFLSQPPGDRCRVAVDDRAEQQFGSHRDDFDDHAPTTSAARSIP